jgi:DNA-binding MarR family transcriptional regulator
VINKSKNPKEAIEHLSRIFSLSGEETGASGPGGESFISEMGRLMYASHRAFQCATGLSGAQWRIIALIAYSEGISTEDINASLQASTNRIAEYKGVSQRKVQEVLDVDAAGITRSAKQLEQDGYVRRETDPADNRFTLLYLTDKGRHLYEETLNKVREMWQQAFCDISRDEMLQMRTTLRHLADNLTELTEAPVEQ